MNKEATTHTITSFEASASYTPAVKADAIAILKALTAQTVLSQADVYDRLQTELTAKYVGQAATLGYLKAIALDYLDTVQEYASDALNRLQAVRHD